MEKRTLGRTNLKVSVLGCGGGAFYDPDMTGREVSNVMTYLAHKGVNLFETAEDYDEKKMAEISKKWAPYRTYAALLLWHHIDNQ